MSSKSVVHPSKAYQRRQAADALFSIGLNWHIKGDLVSAKAIYEQVLANEPQHFDALHMLGVVALQTRDALEAERLISKAIDVDPRHSVAYSNRGNALKALGRMEEAVISYRLAIKLKPDYVDAYSNLGNALKDTGQFDAADEAYRQALSLKPDFPEGHFNRGVTQEQRGLWDEALRSYREAIRCRPEYAEAHTNIANLLKQYKLYPEALTHYDEAARLLPLSAEAQTNRGIGLHDLRRLNEALQSFDAAIRINPEYAEAYSNRAATLHDLGRVTEALADCDRALQLKPNYAEAYSNRGLALFDLKRFDEAISALDCAISIMPSLQDAKWNKAMVMLARQKWTNGWPLFQHRDRALGARLPSIPLWEVGEPHGQVLILAEQGIGDEIFYGKSLSLYMNLFAKPTCVTLDRRLIPIYERSFPGVRFWDRSQTHLLKPIDFDLQMALGDLLVLMEVDPNKQLSVAEPHLIVNSLLPKRLGLIKTREDRPRIGLSWKSKNAKFGGQKSMSLIDMMRELKDVDADWVNLQYGEVDNEVVQVQRELGVSVRQVEDLDVTQDLDGLLKLIHDCDYVITTSNSTAHLCGAIGKPAAVMVPFGRGKIWYWHLEDGPSPWYPSLNIIHCKEANGWPQALQQAKQAFKEHHGLTH